FVRAGAELSEDAKQRIREINTEVSSLIIEFQRNLMTLARENTVIVDSKEELAGLSEAQIQAYADAAVAAGHPGKYAISITNTTRQPVLASLENRELRQRISEASAYRGTGNTA